MKHIRLILVSETGRRYPLPYIFSNLTDALGFAEAEITRIQKTPFAPSLAFIDVENLSTRGRHDNVQHF